MIEPWKRCRCLLVLVATRSPLPTRLSRDPTLGCPPELPITCRVDQWAANLNRIFPLRFDFKDCLNASLNWCPL
jgi:hypothetical protein